MYGEKEEFKFDLNTKCGYIDSQYQHIISFLALRRLSYSRFFTWDNAFLFLLLKYLHLILFTFLPYKPESLETFKTFP